jgi:hypothetical protein
VARKQKQKKVKQHPVIIKPVNESMKRRDVGKSMNAALDAELETNGIDFILNNGIVLRCALSTNANDAVDSKPKVLLPKVKILRVNDPEEDEIFIRQIKKQSKI